MRLVYLPFAILHLPFTLLLYVPIDLRWPNATQAQTYTMYTITCQDIP